MPNYLSQNELNQIKKTLENGGIIAFPTDTVWGIGCLPENKKAVEKIYSIKSRDRGKPLILLGKNLDALMSYVEAMPKVAVNIAKKYFPGAITLVIKKNLRTPDFVTAGFDTVGIRIPDCPIFIEVLEKCTEYGVLATTSANISETAAALIKQEVIDSIGSEIDYILDDYGCIPKGVESTVISVDESNAIRVLRQGAVFLS